MTSLKIYLLGTPGLERNGSDGAMETRKALALLAYLVVTGQAHTRASLAALLWGDYGPARAYANLRRTLLALTTAQVRELVDANAETVRLNPTGGLDNRPHW